MAIPAEINIYCMDESLVNEPKSGIISANSAKKKAATIAKNKAVMKKLSAISGLGIIF